MAPKRPLPPPEEAEDGGRSRALKRWRPLVLEVLGEQRLQRLLVELEKVFRRVVREELVTLCANNVYQPSNQDKKIRYRLHFRNKLPKVFFTFNSILAEDGMNLQIALMDSNLREVITSNPLSSVKVEIVVIDGDFVGDVHEYWTEKQFKDRAVPPRDDNSSWTRSQKFRLGVRLSQSECFEDRVQEGISEPFRVKDCRGELNQKHHSPSLTDEVWRLKNIMKDGIFHKRLVDGGIHTVQQFLQAFTMNHEGLQSLLGDKAKKKQIPNKKWQGILSHAQKCPVGNELYSYSVSGKNFVLIFNSIYQLLGAKFDGHYHSMGDLTASQQKLVDYCKKLAFENPNDIHIMVDNLPQPITPIKVPSVPGSSSLDPQIPYNNGENHDEATTQVGLWHQPNAPHNKNSNVLFHAEDISVEDKVHSIQESSSFQEPIVSNGLSVGRLIRPEPQNYDHPATYTDESAADMGFHQLPQDISKEQDFSQFQQLAFFQGNVSPMNDILDARLFGIESCTGRVDEYMPDDECEEMVLEYLKAGIPTSPRKWVKLIAGLKCGLSISKYLAARRTGIVHLSSKQ
ncbi:calmodulin-binding protein 60 D-like isoform X2 [Phoenix dactylifera]|uniref:Calmodulin-binding protein 60 D-like isoform X2 n=1 Tax=Phoenix dactylifera TaxID=42345 RepID=A0A8B7MV13_PHODC|nr:calmodulin-binding protein 60 D-like isoform X2 [Phoenix dactylifera]